MEKLEIKVEELELQEEMNDTLTRILGIGSLISIIVFT